jgi:DNA repair protein RadC
MQRARERLALCGAAALSDVELVALLLGAGRSGENVTSVAARLIEESGGLSALGRMRFAELTRLPSVGPAKAARMAAAFEAGLRALTFPNVAATPLSNSEAVFLRHGRKLIASRVERFIVVAVDAKNRPSAECEVARGGRTSCQVDPAEVFRMLISESASGAVFLHNHPSGDPQPSIQDLDLTERLVAAGSLLDIRILDHLVVGNGRYTSLRDAGLLPANAAKSGPSACLTR